MFTGVNFIYLFEVEKKSKIGNGLNGGEKELNKNVEEMNGHSLLLSVAFLVSAGR